MNDNVSTIKAEAVICLMQWLADDGGRTPGEVVGACDALRLSEADIEYLCRQYAKRQENVVPISPYINF